MKILVTGGTGFLGRCLGEKLKAEGHEVTMLGRNKNICAELEQKHFKVIQADLSSAEQTMLACANQDYIFHCAALSSPWGKYADFYAANVIGTRNIINSCLQHNIRRFIHVSTPSIYFDYSDRLNISETAPLPLHPVNAYAKTKLLAEQEVTAAQQAGLDTIIIRPRGIFGPNDTAIIPRLIKAHETMPLPIFKQGKVLVDMTYVENVADALIASMHAPKTVSGMTFNITNDEPMYLIDLINLLFGKLNIQIKTRKVNYTVAHYAAWLLEKLYELPFISKEPPFTQYTLGLLAYSQTLDISQAKRMLAYQPKISIDEGLDRYIASLKAGTTS